jgi:hypothetical protein
MSKRDREREANRLRKGEGTAGLGSGVGPVRHVVPTTEQVLELLEEEAKLRVRVEEADALRARLQEHAQWADKARALLSEVPGPDDAFKSVLSACTAHAGDAGGSGEHAANANSMDQQGAIMRLSAMSEKGELLGIALGEQGRRIQVLLWSIKTGRLLAACTGTGGAEVHACTDARTHGRTHARARARTHTYAHTGCWRSLTQACISGIACVCMLICNVALWMPCACFATAAQTAGATAGQGQSATG